MTLGVFAIHLISSKVTIRNQYFDHHPSKYRAKEKQNLFRNYSIPITRVSLM